MTTQDICIVTPSFNSVRTIDETIISVISQAGDFRLWYHVQDGGSRDGTIDRLDFWATTLRYQSSWPKYCRSLRFTFASETDQGMYDAINRGFSKTEGSLMGWINADDLLMPGAIQTIVEYLRGHPQDAWVGGRTALMRHDGIRTVEIYARAYNPEMTAAGIHDGSRLPYLQQEGQMWRRSLWELAGGKLNDGLRYAGDFELWTRFANHAELVSIDAPLAAFRVHPSQKTAQMSQYVQELQEVQQVLGTEKASALYARYMNGESFPGIVALIQRGSPTFLRRRIEERCDTLIRHGRPYLDKPTWTVVSGGDNPEGPYPEDGIHFVLRWLLGSIAVLQFDAQNRGKFLVTIYLHNYHHGQSVLVTSDGVSLGDYRIPTNDITKEPAYIRFFLQFEAQRKLVQLRFTKVEEGKHSHRPLSCALTGVEIQRVEANA